MNDPMKELVERELRGQASEQEVALLSEDPVQWRSYLVELLQAVTQQFTDLAADRALQIANRLPQHEWRAWEADWLRRRSGTNAFKMKVEKKLQQVRRLQKEHGQSELWEERLVLQDLVAVAADIVPRDGKGEDFHARYREYIEDWRDGNVLRVGS